LIFISVIAFCNTLERTEAEAKAESQYTAATKALKLGAGYKEMFQFFNLEKDANKNYDVTLKVDGQKFPCQLQMTLLNTNSFLSGIPFYTKAALPDLNSSPILKNFMKLNDNSFYLPFNTIQGGLNWDFSFGGFTAYLSNNHGSTQLDIDFKTFANMDEEQHAFEVYNELDTRRRNRSISNNRHINNLNRALYQVRRAQFKIDNIRKSEAEFRKSKMESIAKLKLEIETSEKRLKELSTQKISVSNLLQTSKNSQGEMTIKLKNMTLKKKNMEQTIQTLKSKISSQQIITDLGRKMTGDMDLLKYWIQGSIYHRIITENEKNQLLSSVLDDKKFDSMLNGYFFPQ
jgi:hypothetical protein